MFFNSKQEIDSATFDSSTFPKGWKKDGNNFFIPAELRPFYGTREPASEEVSAAVKALRFQLYCEENPKYEAAYASTSSFWDLSRSVPSAAGSILSEWEARELLTIGEIQLAQHRAKLNAAASDLSITVERIKRIERDRKENTCPLCGEWPAPDVETRKVLNGTSDAFSLRSCSSCFVVAEDVRRASFGHQELESGETRAAAVAAFFNNR